MSVSIIPPQPAHRGLSFTELSRPATPSVTNTSSEKVATKMVDVEWVYEYGLDGEDGCSQQEIECFTVPVAPDAQSTQRQHAHATEAFQVKVPLRLAPKPTDEQVTSKTQPTQPTQRRRTSTLAAFQHKHPWRLAYKPDDKQVTSNQQQTLRHRASSPEASSTQPRWNFSYKPADRQAMPNEQPVRQRRSSAPEASQTKPRWDSSYKPADKPRTRWQRNPQAGEKIFCEAERKAQEALNAATKILKLNQSFPHVLPKEGCSKTAYSRSYDPFFSPTALPA